jgi:hypothetical protein
MNKLVEVYCDVDDFCQLFVEHWQQKLLSTHRKVIRYFEERLTLHI